MAGVLVVNEIFGPTFQGEGPSAGRLCAFLRLGGCNLACRWCDTPYTWDWTGAADGGHAYRPADELHPMGEDAVLERLLAYPVDLVVVSGGEPLSQQRRLLGVVRALRAAGREIEIETNGTVTPLPELIETGVRFNVSPKLSHSGDPERRRIVPDALEAFAGTPNAVYKFVCRERADLDEVAEITARFGLRPVWIMPIGSTPGQLVRGLEELADEVVGRGWNMTGRLHLLTWGDRRGV